MAFVCYLSFHPVTPQLFVSCQPPPPLPGPELLWDDQAESGSASSSSAGASNEAAMPPAALVSASEASEVIQQDCAKPEEGPLRLDAHNIYETALQCAFAAENCSSTKLETSGPWTWLLYTFAEQYGVRPFFCVLCHLRYTLHLVDCIHSLPRCGMWPDMADSR
jgi:hypothetical protein